MGPIAYAIGMVRCGAPDCKAGIEIPAQQRP